jgi:hypothetical protein
VNKKSIILSLIFGAIIFSLTKYCTKRLKVAKKEPIKASTVETNIIDKKNKSILIPSAQSVNSAPQQNYLGTGGKTNSKR